MRIVKMLLRQLKIEMKLYVRDKQAVFWSFFFPVFLILLFGFIFSKPNSIKFNIGFVDEDTSRESAELLLALNEIPVLKIEQNDRKTMLAQLNESKKSLAIIVPNGYADSVKNGRAKVEVVYDESQVQVLQVVTSLLGDLINRINWELIEVEPPIRIEHRSITPGSHNRGYIDFLLPGIISMSVVSTCLFSIGMVVVAYREKGKLRRLAVTPLPKSVFIAGQMLNRYFIILVQAFILITLGRLVFGVEMTGSVLDFFVALTIGMLAFIAMGFFIASIAKTSETATGIANTLFLPMIFLSGVYFSVDGMPKFLKPLVEFLPLTHLVRAVRSIFMNGLTLADVLPQLGILSIWMVVLFGLSIKLFKWE